MNNMNINSAIADTLDIGNTDTEKKTGLIGFYNYTVVLTYIGMWIGFLGVMLAIVLISIIAVVAISTKSNVGGNKQGKKPAEASIYTDDKEKPSSQHTKDKPSQKEFENYAKILGELFCDAFGDEAYYFVSGDTVFMSMDVDISRRELVSYLAESSFVESYKVLREAIVSACKTTYDTFERDGYDDYNVYICVGTNDGCEIVTAYNGQKMFDLYENEYKD